MQHRCQDIGWKRRAVSPTNTLSGPVKPNFPGGRDRARSLARTWTKQRGEGRGHRLLAEVHNQRTPKADHLNPPPCGTRPLRRIAQKFAWRRTTCTVGAVPLRERLNRISGGEVPRELQSFAPDILPATGARHHFVSGSIAYRVERCQHGVTGRGLGCGLAERGGALPHSAHPSATLSLDIGHLCNLSDFERVAIFGFMNAQQL